MIALDTNVLVRIFTRDDADQAARAAKLMRSAPLFVSKTVLLETEWVLRYVYGFDRSAIQSAFTLLAGLPTLQLEDMSAVTSAITWYQEGMDFADALHLASTPSGATAFATFDRKLAASAKKLDHTVRVRLLHRQEPRGRR